MNSSWVIKNSPYEMLDIAFKRLFPSVKYTAYFEPNIRDDEHGEKVRGLTDFAADGEITIFVDSELSVNDTVEIFAHELAHAGVGVEQGHNELWQKAFDDLFNEYNEIGEELFSSNITPHYKGKDYANALEELGYTDHPTEKVCTGERCPMQVGYDVKSCKDKDCIYRTETEKGGEEE